MESIAVEKAVGMTLCQDVTQVIRGVSKGPRFRRGHVIRQEDIPVLLDMGKEHLYVFEKQEGILHEEDAAKLLYQMCESEYLRPSGIQEGKIEAIATTSGVLVVDQERLKKVNLFGETMIATKNNYQRIVEETTVAGMRIIPLMIEEEKMKAVQRQIGNKPLLAVRPYTPKKVGIITTGSEVFKGRIKDAFEPVLKEKLASFPAEIVTREIVSDSKERIVAAIQRMKEQQLDIILCTGGMSVDADDRTPEAIQDSGATIVSYGTPVLPGAMFLLAYADTGTAIMGLPGAVIFAETTVFDLILPRVMANIPVSATDIAEMGCGGLL